MDYLARNLDLRYDPQKLVEGTKTIVSVALNYYPAQKMNPGEYTLSYYAYGKDYHVVVKQRLFELFRLLKEKLLADGFNLEGRAFCDTAPVSERYWAWRAGVGFIGKNTLLIIPHKGSFFFSANFFERRGRPLRRAFEKFLRQLHKMHRCLSRRRYLRTLCTRCAPLSVVSHN